MKILYAYLMRLFPLRDYSSHAGARWLWFSRFDIPPEGPDVYLRRFVLARTPWGSLYLHQFFRGDADRCLHDHPWRFASLILWGGYWEETPVEAAVYRDLSGERDQLMKEPLTDERQRRWYGPGSFRRMPAHHVHRVVLPEGARAWTLVWTSPKVRVWGFWTPGGWMPWREFEESGEEC